MPNSARKKNNDDGKSFLKEDILTPNPCYPRYTNIPFPAYRFIPGKSPHPADHRVNDNLNHSNPKTIGDSRSVLTTTIYREVSIDDPQGHSYQKRIEIPNVLENQNWPTNERYLFAVDLYNYAFWWEAHEALESLWQITEKKDTTRDFLQGLIKICAAFLKWHSQKIRGVKILFAQGYDHLQAVKKFYPVYMGLDLEEYSKNLKTHFVWLNEESVQWKDPFRNYPFLVLKKDKTEG